MSLRTLFSAFEEQLALFSATASPSACSSRAKAGGSERTSIFTRGPTEQLLGGDHTGINLKLLPGEPHHEDLLLPSRGSRRIRRKIATSHLEALGQELSGNAPSAGTGFLFRLQHHAGAEVEAAASPAPASSRGTRSRLLSGASADERTTAGFFSRAAKIVNGTTKKARGPGGATSFYLDCSAESGAMEVMPRSVKNMCQKYALQKCLGLEGWNLSC